MLRLSITLMLWAHHAKAADLQFIDSKVSPKVSWVLVDDCAVPILKTKVGDQCYVLKKVNDFCHLDLNMDDCHGK